MVYLDTEFSRGSSSMRILLVYADDDLARGLTAELRAVGHGTRATREFGKMRALARPSETDMVIIDARTAAVDGVGLAAALRAGGCMLPLAVLASTSLTASRV